MSPTRHTGRRRAAACAVCAACAVYAAPAAAQTVRIGLHGVGLTHTEIASERRAEGGGLGGLISLRWRRFGLDLSGHVARLDSVGGGPRLFDLYQGDARLSYRVATGLALEVGAGRRKIEPEFAAQDVGLARAGILSEIRLSSLGGVWGRGAYLLAPRFSGGGSAGLAVELGFGASLGTRNGRIRGRVEYEFQRIDRTANGIDVPIQTSLAKVGVDVGF
jgi:hypothetical protein